MQAAPPPSAPPPSAAARGLGGGRWLVLGSVLWTLALLAAAVYSYHRDPPTVREQRTIAEAAPVIDRAVGELVAAGQGPGVALEITGRRLKTGCRLTAGWAGATLERSLILRTVSAAAPAVLDRIAERLPAGYSAGIRRDDAGAARRVWADAGEFVAVTGAATSPGVVTLTAKSGCRPPSPGFDPAANTLPGAVGAGGARLPLMMIDATAITPPEMVVVPCPGGVLPAMTERASGDATLGPAERERLAGPRSAVVIIDATTEFAMGAGASSYLLRVDGDRVDSIYTMGCTGLRAN